MDPLANLLEQLRLSDQLLSCKSPGRGCKGCHDAGQRLAELVHALDGWLRGGGVLPTRWQTRWQRLYSEHGAAPVNTSRKGT